MAENNEGKIIRKVIVIQNDNDLDPFIFLENDYLVYAIEPGRYVKDRNGNIYSGYCYDDYKVGTLDDLKDQIRRSFEFDLEDNDEIQEQERLAEERIMLGLIYEIDISRYLDEIIECDEEEDE